MSESPFTDRQSPFGNKPVQAPYYLYKTSAKSAVRNLKMIVTNRGNLKIFIGAMVIVGIFAAFNVSSSPQMAIYNLNKAAKKEDTKTFNKLYNIPLFEISTDPNVSESAKRKMALPQYQKKYYTSSLTLSKSLGLKTLGEKSAKGSVNTGIIITFKEKGHTLYYRLIRKDGGWQIVDIAKQ